MLARSVGAEKSCDRKVFCRGDVPVGVIVAQTKSLACGQNLNFLRYSLHSVGFRDLKSQGKNHPLHQQHTSW